MKKLGPELEKKIESLGEGSAEVGWIDEHKISKYGFPPSIDTRVLVCGLPGVYEKLCGPRTNTTVPAGSVLHKLGYTDDMVIKF